MEEVSRFQTASLFLNWIDLEGGEMNTVNTLMKLGSLRTNLRMQNSLLLKEVLILIRNSMMSMMNTLLRLMMTMKMMIPIIFQPIKPEDCKKSPRIWKYSKTILQERLLEWLLTICLSKFPLNLFLKPTQPKLMALSILTLN